MPRPSPPPTTLAGRVRAHFGLEQHELAALLGLSRPMLTNIEAGRRALTCEVAARLAPFVAAVPTAAEAAAQLLAETQAQADATAPLPAPPPGPVAPGPLEKRRAACLHEARALRWQLRGLPAQARQAAAWAAALPGILAALPPPPPEGQPPATPEQARLRYVHSWLATVPLALSPEVLTQWHLLRQRALALEAEAAALAALLGG